MPEHQLLSLVVPAEITDDVVDCLFSLSFISGFGHSKISGHSREHGAFNLQEQVAGSRAMIRFEVLHAVTDQQALMSALTPVCTTAGARYWVTPVTQQGHFDGA